MYGCEFRWKSTVREHLKPGGLLVLESEEEDFADVIQWLLVLVYIRPADVRHYFGAIVDFVDKKVNDEKDAKWVEYRKPLEKFFQYMQKTWVGGDDGEGIKVKYDSDRWSSSRSLLDPSIPITSIDATEAYKFQMTRAVGWASGNRFWRTVQAIQDEEWYARYTTPHTTMSLLLLLLNRPPHPPPSARSCRTSPTARRSRPT